MRATFSTHSLGKLLVAAATVGLMWPSATGWAQTVFNCPGTLQTFSATDPGAVQSFTVPNGVTSVTIDALGGRGGGGGASSRTGGGAEVAATFPVTPGTSLKIIAGTAGKLSNTGGGGGGGGSFVYTTADVNGLLLAAAGGGGGGFTIVNNGSGGIAPTGVGAAGATPGAAGGLTGGAGGTAGGGGGGGVIVGLNAGGGGGGGLLTNGGIGGGGPLGGGGGKAIANGGTPGDGGASTAPGGAGGFGGGAGGGAVNGGGGGGGGFNGGGGGTAGGGGGGGGSYSAVATSIATSGTNRGDGVVRLCFAPPVTLTVSKTGAGTVTSGDGKINCGATCSASNYPNGTTVVLTATASPGSVFSGWSGGGCSGTDECTINLTADTTVSATFAVIPSFALSVTKSGTGSGRVSSSPSGIECGATCSASFQQNTQVTLTASASNGSSFTGWSGGGCSGTADCVVTMSAAQNVTAQFDATATPTFALSATTAGDGSGRVTSNPSGIMCGAICSANYPQGTVVTLTQNAAPGSIFAGWSGACSGTGGCTVTMNAASGVTATFAKVTRTLTVSETGAGQVTSSPMGINCSPTSSQCSAGFADGTAVTLTASANTGSAFTGWGGVCSGTDPCQLTLSADTTVSATFTQNLATTSTLLIALADTGDGTVTSSPSGIDCGATCAASFQNGVPITLTATPNGTSTFTGWSGGGCSGTGTCQVTLSANTTVTASFTAGVGTSLLSAILPGSRSVQVGSPATTFASVINTGKVAGTACRIAPQVSVPGVFAFQTTDPATNKVTGSPNTAVSIAAGATQSFVLAFTPNAAFAPTPIPFTFACGGLSPAPVVIGINYFTLSASTTPVPDIITVVASIDPGYMDISPTTSTGAFSVATINFGGAGGTLTAIVDTGVADLPLVLSICQTDPATARCLAPPTPRLTLPIAAGATNTFSVFATASAAIPDQPAVNRVFVRFIDSDRNLRGQSSEAVRTRSTGTAALNN